MESLPKPAGVIVADDDPLIRSVLKRKLEEFGQTVYQASNGAEAVSLAECIDACLIILDIRMPRLDGVQACVQIRELPGYEHTPIVMLTFQDNKKAQTSASRAGATMFLVKPFGTATLMLALSRFLPIDEATQKTIHADAVRATGGRVFVRPPSPDGRSRL
ncbi:MAG TPA: response regulator [Acetobacteraceae bacterium]|jgi:CheY-like chemotaxis protein|nr:response regulator [Acetobacteraceae bacterium]